MQASDAGFTADQRAQLRDATHDTQQADASMTEQTETQSRDQQRESSDGIDFGDDDSSLANLSVQERIDRARDRLKRRKEARTTETKADDQALAAERQDQLARLEETSESFRRQVQGSEAGSGGVAEQARQFERDVLASIRERTGTALEPSQVRIERAGETLKAALTSSGLDALDVNPSNAEIREQVAKRREGLSTDDLAVERDESGTPTSVSVLDEALGDLTGETRQDRSDPLTPSEREQQVRTSVATDLEETFGIDVDPSDDLRVRAETELSKGRGGRLVGETTYSVDLTDEFESDLAEFQAENDLLSEFDDLTRDEISVERADGSDAFEVLVERTEEAGDYSLTNPLTGDPLEEDVQEKADWFSETFSQTAGDTVASFFGGRDTLAGTAAGTATSSVVELVNLPQTARMFDEAVIEPTLYIGEGATKGEAGERAGDVFDAGGQYASRQLDRYFEINPENAESLIGSTPARQLRDSLLEPTGDGRAFEFESRKRAAELAGIGIGAGATAGATYGLIGGLSKVSPRGARGLSFAIQPGEELALGAARRVQGARPRLSAGTARGRTAISEFLADESGRLDLVPRDRSSVELDESFDSLGEIDPGEQLLDQAQFELRNFADAERAVQRELLGDVDPAQSQPSRPEGPTFDPDAVYLDRNAFEVDRDTRPYRGGRGRSSGPVGQDWSFAREFDDAGRPELDAGRTDALDEFDAPRNRLSQAETALRAEISTDPLDTDERTGSGLFEGYDQRFDLRTGEDTLERLDQDFGVRQDTGFDQDQTFRLDSDTDQRLDQPVEQVFRWEPEGKLETPTRPRWETPVRPEPFTFEPESGSAVVDEPIDDADDPFTRAFINPVATPEELLGDAFGDTDSRGGKSSKRDSDPFGGLL